MFRPWESESPAGFRSSLLGLCGEGAAVETQHSPAVFVKLVSVTMMIDFGIPTSPVADVEMGDDKIHHLAGLHRDPDPGNKKRVFGF